MHCCRDNILFGRSWQQERYEAVLKACALEADIQQMTEGDATLIGDRGVTLSGGQRARLSLARAVYQVLYADMSALPTNVMLKEFTH